MDRFAEYVYIVDELLSQAPEPIDYQGRWHSCRGLGIAPPPIRRPRPPLTIGGQSQVVLSVAARHGDRWNTHGPFGASVEEILKITHRQNGQLDPAVRAVRPRPAELRRSLLMIFDLDAWSEPDSFERIVDSFLPAGITEFVIFWPTDQQRPRFDRAVAELIPARRT